MTAPLPLSALLSRVLLAFTADFEQASRLSLAVSANVLRVLDEDGLRVRDLPALTGVSKEAVAVSLGFLERHGYALVEPDPAAPRTRVARLTPLGLGARRKYPRILAEVETAWRRRLGGRAVSELRDALRAVTGAAADGEPCLSLGLRPPPDGWRAHPPYRALTARLLADPVAGLPQYPMVSHRGGFPDGS
ncbi:hypothetical protein [Streptomyces sp. NPDC051569]|uniref:hypothetical protein n=1 Tax=Streptomyces sp. NPDC051569 TaxID=3365661 RepID=UPI0037B34FED